MFTHSPVQILCWEGSWKRELILHPLPTPRKHEGYAKSRSLHVIIQVAGREQLPSSSLSSSARTGPIPFFVLLHLLTLLNFFPSLNLKQRG